MADPVELGDFLKRQPVQLKPIIENGIFYEGSKAILYGKYKSLKSMLAMRFCLAVSRGEQWLGFKTVACNVLYLQLEIVEPMLHKRLKVMTQTKVGNGNGNHPAPKSLWLWTEKTIKIDTQEGFDRVSQWVEKLQPEVLVIDPIYKIVSGDLTSTPHIQKLTDWLDELMDKHKLSLLLIHHSKKGGPSEEWGSDNMLGSSVFNNWADSIIEIKRIAHDLVVVDFGSIRHAETEIGSKYYAVDLKTLDFVASDRKI